ncbi:CRISPR-associated endonuclease Cas2 [Mesoplasma corruscae]|uniref:CRISPR-associated endoribonuclease Cas2 n=1 Tax=Mesoplasma corruscae TaxID=216874 RepID=A0A2S5REB4_9MOLU|nr:CRISPR-associated endonuclease Cas2 [Mesoplasma corruscae]PPE05666.1 CRISPR-associated protein Cas2 [Mesoplasma corruscae]
MRLIILYDLPMNSRQYVKIYTQFRNNLIRNGFVMMQYSIYSKFCTNQDSLNLAIKKVEKLSPKYGNVRILQVTEKQYLKMKIISGKKKQSRNIPKWQKIGGDLMIIRNYNRIKYLNFNLTDNKYFLCRDLLFNADLINILKTFFQNKKSDAEIKIDDYDNAYNFKNLEIIEVPSFIDFQKDFLLGTKSVYKLMLTVLLETLESKSEILIEAANILNTFKIENENEYINNEFNEVENDLKIKLKTFFNPNFVSFLVNSISIDFEKDNNLVDETNITIYDLKQIYLRFLSIFETF